MIRAFFSDDPLTPVLNEFLRVQPVDAVADLLRGELEEFISHDLQEHLRALLGEAA